MIVQQVRNATLKVYYGKAVFLVDPWLQDKGTGVSARAVRPEMQGVKCPLNDLPDAPGAILSGVDCCLVTHLHFDHFSPDYLPQDLRIIAQNPQDASRLRELGFRRAEAFEGDRMAVGGVAIRKVAAVHGDGEEVLTKMGEACGYVLEAPGEKALYIAGDTVWCAEVERAIDLYRPGLIVLNCCEATTPLGRLIMGLPDVERVCASAPWAQVIASHLDSVNHALLTSEDVRRFARDRGLTQLLVPANGERVDA